MPRSPTAEMQTTLLTTTTTTTTTTFSKTKQLAVRTWLEDIPASFASNNATTNAPARPPSAQLCTMARSSEKSLAALAASGTIVLFTPVVVTAKPTGKPSSAASPSPINTDPFEPLGRALSRHHKRIRHVPYHPKVGFTDTHDAFCSQADAVVVVVCDATAHSATTKAASLRDQLEFAETAHAALLKESLGRPLKHPLALIQCGSVDEGAAWPGYHAGFEIVLKCRASGDVETAREVARKLFGKD